VKVKIGEHLLALSAIENNFFRGEQPRKDLHHLHRDDFAGCQPALRVENCG
jgi:hypothetical protein